MDKKKLLIVAGLALLLWLLLKRKKVVTQSESFKNAGGNDDPLLLAYANDPARNEPAKYTYNIDGSNANVNLGPQGFGYLDNKYIPLFGFVGMAQGETWL